MPFKLIRIDERLIHGQVLIGWGNHSGIRYYFVVDDRLASSSWEQELWTAALGDDVSADFLTVAEAARRFAELDSRAGSGALLVRDTATMLALAKSGCLEGRSINVGGVHDAPGRRKILDYLYLSPAEVEDLAAIERYGGVVCARDLPLAPAVPLSAFKAR